MSAGKGCKPRNCFSQQYRDNYDQIDWAKKPVRPPYVSIKDDGIVVIDGKALDRLDELLAKGLKIIK